MSDYKLEIKPTKNLQKLGKLMINLSVITLIDKIII